jgi:hypothetical protein
VTESIIYGLEELYLVMGNEEWEKISEQNIIV